MKWSTTGNKQCHTLVRVNPTDDSTREMIKYGDDKNIDIHLKKDQPLESCQ